MALRLSCLQIQAKAGSPDELEKLWPLIGRDGQGNGGSWRGAALLPRNLPQQVPGKGVKAWRSEKQATFSGGQLKA